jgi:hypothetical protein
LRLGKPAAQKWLFILGTSQNRLASLRRVDVMNIDGFKSAQAIHAEFCRLKLDAEDALTMLQAAHDYCQLTFSDLDWQFLPKSGVSPALIYGRLDSKKETISAIHIDPAVGASFYSQIEAFMEKLRNPVSFPVRRPMLSERLLTGFVEVETHFRLYPIHQWMSITDSGIIPSGWIIDGHDHTKDQFGPPFPIELEIFVDVPVEHPLFFKKCNSKMDAYQYLISLCVRGVSSISFQSQDRMWSGHFDDSKTHYAYRLANFGITTFSESSFDRYRNEGGQAAAWYEGETEYFDALFMEQQLSVPRVIQTFFTQFETLDEKRKRDYVRACFLFSQAEFLRNHKGESTVTYASSIECLFDKSTKRCEICNQEVHGLSSKFKCFMETYAPVSERVKKQREAMYNRRSRVPMA